jgi:hypothetical protein
VITKEQIKAHNRRVRIVHALTLLGNIAIVAWVVYGLHWLGVL